MRRCWLAILVIVCSACAARRRRRIGRRGRSAPSFPFGPGSAVDVVPRIVFEQMSTQLGQSIVVENRGGAGGTIGSARGRQGRARRLHHPGAFVARTPSRRRSIPNLSYDVARDFVTVGAIGSVPNVMIIAPSKGFKTVQEYVAWAKANPNAANFATVGRRLRRASERGALSPQRRLRRRAHSLQGRRRGASPRSSPDGSTTTSARSRPRCRTSARAGCSGSRSAVRSGRRRCRTSRPRWKPAIRIPTTRSGWACSRRPRRRPRSSRS